MEATTMIVYLVGGAVGIALEVWISYALAKAKGQMPLGLVLGLFLGPLGWLITAMLPNKAVPAAKPVARPSTCRTITCASCGKPVKVSATAARGNVCPWCGGEMTRFSAR